MKWKLPFRAVFLSRPPGDEWRLQEALPVRLLWTLKREQRVLRLPGALPGVEA